MNEDKVREEFEAFAKAHDVYLDRAATGEYSFSYTRLLYKTWLVALAHQERLMVGDYFTHDRTGARFVCRAVVRHDYDGLESKMRAEIELAEETRG